MNAKNEQVDGGGGVKHCPFDDCEWSTEYDESGLYSEPAAERSAEQHYEREHAGRVEIQVALTREQMIGSRDTEEIRQRILDEKADDFGGFEVAFVRTEVLEEASDHSKLEDG